MDFDHSAASISMHRMCPRYVANTTFHNGGHWRLISTSGSVFDTPARRTHNARAKRINPRLRYCDLTLLQFKYLINLALLFSMDDFVVQFSQRRVDQTVLSRSTGNAWAGHRLFTRLFYSETLLVSNRVDFKATAVGNRGQILGCLPVICKMYEWIFRAA